MLGPAPREFSRLIALDELRIVLALAAADLDQDRRLKVAALHIMLDAIAVFARREPSSGPLTGIDPKTRALDVFVIDDRLAVAARDVVATRVVRNFDDFPEELVGLPLSRACTSQEILTRAAEVVPPGEVALASTAPCAGNSPPWLRVQAQARPTARNSERRFSCGLEGASRAGS